MRANSRVPRRGVSMVPDHLRMLVHICKRTLEAFMKPSASVLVFVLLGTLPFVGSQDTSSHGANYSVRTVPLPDNNMGDVAMDYIAYDPSTNSIWVPGGNTGAVDVVDAATGKVRRIPNLPTKEIDFRGGKRILGPAAVSMGEGAAYIGNRGDLSICSFNPMSFERGVCAYLDATPDAVVFVAPTKEVWVTTPTPSWAKPGPGDKTIRVLDAKTLEQKAKITFEGNPEGYAVDAVHGRFYTNFEDKDRSLAIDLKTHKTVANWSPSCGTEGPHGLAVDANAGLLFVACTSLVEVLDAGHDGAILSMVDTGDGVDGIYYSPATHLLYVGAAKAAKLTIARADGNGRLSIVAQVPTREGARNGVVDQTGNVYLGHTIAVKLAALVVVSPGGK
jgi:DNA-binding beta-propeller fold protein YncE